MNKTIILGNVGADAQVKSVNAGVSVIEFPVAVTEKYKGKDGNVNEKTAWYRCAIWRKPEQVKLAGCIKKGDRILLEGEVSASAYTDQQGNAKASLELRVKEVTLLGTRTRNDQSGSIPTSGNDDLPF